MSKQIYRSSNDRIISGVCGGLSNYLDLDSTLVRIIWAVISLVQPIVIIAYIVCMIIIPESPAEHVDVERGTSTNHNLQGKNNLVIGLSLIAFGTLIILKRYIYWFRIKDLWPIILVVIGLYLIIRKNHNKN